MVIAIKEYVFKKMHENLNKFCKTKYNIYYDIFCYIDEEFTTVDEIVEYCKKFPKEIQEDMLEKIEVLTSEW